METKDIGSVNNFANNCISVMLDYTGDDNGELMEQIRVAVQYNDYGTPYVLAEHVMEILNCLAKKSQNHPIQNLYTFNNY